MAVKIRLARAGAKKRPYYHIVVASSASPRDGRFIEIVGAYNPMLGKSDEKRVKLDTEKVQAWLKKGTQPTDRPRVSLPANRRTSRCGSSSRESVCRSQNWIRFDRMVAGIPSS